MEMITAFEISRWSNGVLGEFGLRIVIGLAAGAAGLVGLWRAWRRRAAWKDWVYLVFITGWAALWLAMHLTPNQLLKVEDLVDAYRRGSYEIVEGPVVVLHRQPAHGHTKGDVVRIGASTFEINHFVVTPAYRDTIAHGGVLDDGVYARIYHRDGAILRLEVRKGN